MIANLAGLSTWLLSKRSAHYKVMFVAIATNEDEEVETEPLDLVEVLANAKALGTNSKDAALGAFVRERIASGEWVECSAHSILADIEKHIAEQEKP